MKVVAGDSLFGFGALGVEEQAKIGLVGRFVVAKAGVEGNAKQAAFGLCLQKRGIKATDLGNKRLGGVQYVLFGSSVARGMGLKPFPVVVLGKFCKKL
jgi:hypothetical protein